MWVVLGSGLVAQNEPVDTIDVAYTKSSFLIFNEEPKYIPGSEDIIVQQIENKIIIQAATRDFDETNLMVQVGADYHLFLVRYNENVKDFFHNYQRRFKRDHLVDSSVIEEKVDGGDLNPLKDVTKLNEIKTGKQTKDSIVRYFKLRCDSVMEKQQEIRTLGVMKYKYLAYVSNMYVDDNYFYIRYGIKNGSNVEFKVDYQSFTIKNKSGTIRKKAYQDLPVKSVYIQDSIIRVPGKTTKEMVLVFDKFTIEKGKLFSIEVWEESGDRRIIVDIDYKHLINIKEL